MLVIVIIVRSSYTRCGCFVNFVVPLRVVGDGTVLLCFLLLLLMLVIKEQ